MTRSSYDAGQNGVHGEDAGGEGEPQPQREEGGDAEPEALAAEGRGQLILLTAGWGAGHVIGGGRICIVSDDRLHRNLLVGGRVAEAVGTALIADGEAGLLARLGQGDGDLHLPVVDPGLAEEVILMLCPGGQDGLTEGEVLALEAEAVAVEVVIIGDAQGQQQLVALLFTLEHEGVVDFQKLGLGVGLDAKSAQQTVTAGLNRRHTQGGQQQGEEHKQGGEQARQCHEVSCVNQSR